MAVVVTAMTAISNACGVAALILWMISAGIVEIARLNDPEEPIFPRRFPKAQHARRARPLLLATVPLALIYLIGRM